MARRRGVVELAVSREIKALPAEKRGALASVAIVLAREVDSLDFRDDPGVSRDLATVSKELRATLADLGEDQDVKVKGGRVDELNAARERRRAGSG